MSKTAARSTENSKADSFDYVLDETVPLPTMPEWSNMAARAANDELFASQVTGENIERLITLAESMDKHLKKIAESLATPTSQPSRSRTKKKRVTKKRTTKKNAAEQ